MLLKELLLEYKEIRKNEKRSLFDLSPIELGLLVVMIAVAVIYVFEVIVDKKSSILALAVVVLILSLTSVLQNKIWKDRYPERLANYKIQYLPKVKKMLDDNNYKTKEKVEMLIEMVQAKQTEKNELLGDVKPVLGLTMIFGPLSSKWIDKWLGEAIETSNLNMITMYILVGVMIYCIIIAGSLILSDIVNEKKNTYRNLEEDLKNILLTK